MSYQRSYRSTAVIRRFCRRRAHKKGEERGEEVGFRRRHCHPPTTLPPSPSGVNDGVEFPGNGVGSPQGVFFNAFPRWQLANKIITFFVLYVNVGLPQTLSGFYQFCVADSLSSFPTRKAPWPLARPREVRFALGARHTGCRSTETRPPLMCNLRKGNCTWRSSVF